MMRNTAFRQTGLAFAAALALSAAAAAPAFADLAQSKALVDAAKAKGQVGEQGDGYLGVVGGADTQVQAAVAEINAGRASAYRDAAAQTGATPEAAAQAAAVQLINRTPPGQYFKPLGGGWTKK